VNTDGTVIIGIQYDSSFNTHTVLWQSGVSPSFIQNLPSNVIAVNGHAVSGNGSIVVGGDLLSGTCNGGFSWTAGGGVVLLPYPPGQMCSTGGANVISTDGTKIGSTYEQGGSGWNIAYVYNVTTGGTTTLLPGGENSSSVGAMSADGSIVGGNGNIQGPWISTNLGTPQLLGLTLGSLGADLTGITLQYITGMSGNGKVVVGTCHDSGNKYVGWIAVPP